jgi:hypothetical protein
MGLNPWDINALPTYYLKGSKMFPIKISNRQYRFNFQLNTLNDVRTIQKKIRKRKITRKI